MTREEVLEKLKTFGINISGETLRRWVNARLIPTPQRGNIGRAGGRWSNYPPETPWEAFTAWHLLKDNSINKVSKIRNNALPFISNISARELKELNVKLKEWQKETAVIHEQKNERGVISDGYEEILTAEKFIENNKPVYVDSMIFEWLMLRIKSEYGINIQITAKVHIAYWEEWEKIQCPEKFLKEFSSELTDAAGYNPIWQIKSVREHKNDEILIEDINTGAAIVLKDLLQYLYKFNDSLL